MSSSIRKASLIKCLFSLILASTLFLGASVSADSKLDEEVAFLLEQGYMPDAIYFDEIANGYALRGVVESAAEFDPDRSFEFEYLAEHLARNFALPGWVCGGSAGGVGDGWRTIHYEDLEDKTVAEVAEYYLDEEILMVEFLEHFAPGDFPVSELATLSENSKQWYSILPVKNHPMQDAVFVAIYKETEAVSVDGNLGKVLDALAQGREIMPVVFHYYPRNVLPISAIESDNVGMEVIDLYKSDNTRVSPVPNWKAGDYHTMMLIEDLDSLYELPEKEDIDDDLWDKLETEIQTNGFNVAALLEVDEGNMDRYLSEERVAVAKYLGMEEVPVVFFYRPITDYGDVNRDCFTPPATFGSPGGPPFILPGPPPIIPPPVSP